MAIRTRVQDWISRLAGAKTALSELHDVDRHLRDSHKAAKQERDKVAALPPPLDEIVANMERLIDEVAAHEIESYAYSLRDACGGELEFQRDGSYEERKPKLPDGFYRQTPSIAQLCKLVPDLMKARFAEILRAVPYEAGAPLKDRKQLLVAAEERIAEIEREHEQLVETAASFDPPVRLELLPEVKARREAEADRKKRDAAAIKARAEATARVEAANPRAVPSPYLTRQDVPPEVAEGLNDLASRTYERRGS